MNWDLNDSEKWLDQQDEMWGDDDEVPDFTTMTQEEWLEIESDMQYGRQEWEDFRDYDMTAEEYQQWLDFMGFDDSDVEDWLDQQEALYGGDDQIDFDYTKEEWLEWANSMQWDRDEWEDYAYEQDMTDEEWG